MKIVFWLILSALYCTPAAAQQNCPSTPAPRTSNTTCANTAFVQKAIASSPLVSLDPVSFGADPTGVSDSSTAINNAIAALPAGGGEVRFNSCGTYSIHSTINAGNGSSGNLSTRNGVRITSAGMADGKQFAQNCVTLRWDSVSNGVVVFAQGPMSGFEFSGINIDCQSVANDGLVITSVDVWESHRGVHIKNCRTFGVVLNTVVNVGSVGLNTMQGVADNWVIEVPAVANAVGILLDGNCVSNLADAYQNTFNNMQVFIPNTVNVFGVLLGNADTNTFNSLLVFSTLGVVNAGTVGVAFNYAGCSGVPSQNIFNNPDVGFNIPAAQQWGVAGSVNGAPNFINDVNTTNNGADPVITLSAPYAQQGLPRKTGEYVSTGNTGSIGGFVLYSVPETGWYRVNSYIRMTVASGAGTVTPALSWTDDSGAIPGISLPALTATNTTVPSMITIPIYVVAGSNIGAAATASGLSGSPQYTWRMTIEKM